MKKSKTRKKRKLYGTCFLRAGRPAIDQRLTDMSKLASKIKLLRKIKSAMLSTGAYGEIERETQIRKASQRGNLTEEELSMVNDIFDEQKEISNELLKRWNEYKGEMNVLKEDVDVKEYKKKRAKKRLYG